ncbi:MAG: GTPase [Nitrospirota bacterium]
MALVGLRRPDEGPWEIDAAFDAVERWLRVGGRQVVHRVWQRRRAPDCATYLGRGKAEQLRQLCERDGIDGVVVDGALSGSQRAALERVLDRPVWDRAAWSMPSSPSAAVARTREDARRARRSRGAFVVALCGAVGAGKSTLFAELTDGPLSSPSWPPTPGRDGASSVARRLRAVASREVLIVDTPGVIRWPDAARWDVPEAALADCRAADLLVHVIDASYPDATRRAREAAGALRRAATCPMVSVWTQADRVAAPRPIAAEWVVSGRTGSGCDRLRAYLGHVGRVSGPRSRGRGDRPVAEDCVIVFGGTHASVPRLP